MGQEKRILRYSEAFKQKVVGESEKGKLNAWQAQHKYDIKGGSTIQKWIKKLGKNHLLGKVVKIETTNERDKMKEMKKRERDLEKALADAQLKILALESTIEVMEEEYGIKVKKNYGGAGLSDVLIKHVSKKRK